MELEQVIPWGRSLAEYPKMFLLTTDDLNLKILGCADSPASFNAELTKAGGQVISIDPIYQWSPQEIRSRINDVYPQVISQLEKHVEDYIWDNMANIEELGKIRMRAMEQFLNDYALNKETSRYLNASLPLLPFTDNQFNLALCSHYLFLYSQVGCANVFLFAHHSLMHYAMCK